MAAQAGQRASGGPARCGAQPIGGRCRALGAPRPREARLLSAGVRLRRGDPVAQCPRRPSDPPRRARPPPLASGADAAASSAGSDAQPASPAPDSAPGPLSTSSPALPTALLPTPWGLDTVVGVMALWLLAFWSLGYLAVPGVLELLGVARDELSGRGQAVVHLALDAGELGVTAGVLWRCLRAYRPRRLGWFAASLRPVSAWMGPLALTAAAFPLVDIVSARSQAWFPVDGDPWGASVLETAIASGDPITAGLYFVVVSMCAPLWEEAMFRGFLLPSLAAAMPRPAAVATSALAFALAHFSAPRFLPLLLLGLLFGSLYARTRSLGAAVLAHSLWNVYIFCHLLRAG